MFNTAATKASESRAVAARAAERAAAARAELQAMENIEKEQADIKAIGMTEQVLGTPAPRSMRLVPALSVCWQGLRDLFDEIDLDDSGALDETEVRALARRLGKKLSKKELAAAVRRRRSGASGRAPAPAH